MGDGASGAENRGEGGVLRSKLERATVIVSPALSIIKGSGGGDGFGDFQTSKVKKKPKPGTGPLGVATSNLRKRLVSDTRGKKGCSDVSQTLFGMRDGETVFCNCKTVSLGPATPPPGLVKAARGRQRARM